MQNKLSLLSGYNLYTKIVIKMPLLHYTDKLYTRSCLHSLIKSEISILRLNYFYSILGEARKADPCGFKLGSTHNKAKQLHHGWVVNGVMTLFSHWGLWSRSGSVCSLSPCHTRGTYLSQEKDRWTVVEKDPAGEFLNTWGRACYCVLLCVREEVAVVPPDCFLITSQSWPVWTSFHGRKCTCVTNTHTWSIHILDNIHTLIVHAFTNLPCTHLRAHTHTRAFRKHLPTLTHFWTQICPLLDVLILPPNQNRDALERQHLYWRKASHINLLQHFHWQ